LERLVEERTKKIFESEQSYRELYESFGEAFIATDWELNVIHWNRTAERITKISAEEALGKKIYDIFPEMGSIDITNYYESLRDRKPARFMMNIVSRETGNEAVFEISTYPSTVGIIVIVEDKTAEERTKRLSAIGQTAGMIGHDIRNPLQAIAGELFLMKQEIESSPDSQCTRNVQESLNAIQQQVDYMNKIVSDLQDYARPLKPDLVEVDLCTAIPQLLSTVPVPSNVQAFAECDRRLPKLKLDLTFLQRILINLVTNAIQAMPNGGKLTIKAFQQDDSVCITVSDTGVGIPDDIKPKLFQPLMTTKARGQGFGLAVVKRLIEAQGGTINFESKEGKGTQFKITFPR
jgi:PAS domain S-box-containing protein